LAVQLIKPCGNPEMILTIWALKPSFVEPAKLRATVAAIVKILAAAQSEYAARRLRWSMTQKTEARSSST
jgi:hypothetical protein